MFKVYTAFDLKKKFVLPYEIKQEGFWKPDAVKDFLYVFYNSYIL